MAAYNLMGRAGGNQVRANIDLKKGATTKYTLSLLWYTHSTVRYGTVHKGTSEVGTRGLVPPHYRSGPPSGPRP